MMPILVTQLGLFGMSVMDTIMSGHAGTVDLAGVAIGASIWFPGFLLSGGMLAALTPVIAGMAGQSSPLHAMRHVVHQAMWISVFLTIGFVFLGVFGLDRVLNLMHLEPDVARIARHYLVALSWGFLPLFVTAVLQNFFDAVGLARMTMGVVLCALPVNAVLNMGLIFGLWGFPRLGGVGAGYATALTYGFMACACLLIVTLYRPLRRYAILRKSFSWPSWKTCWMLLGIGFPMGFTVFVEASIFSIVTLLVGAQFDTQTTAANQATISFAGLLFMIPMSISMTLTIVVAYEVGAKRWHDAKQYIQYGITMAMGVMLCLTACVAVFRASIASLYTPDRAVMETIVALLGVVVLFQLFDALQSTFQGCLRGLKDVTVPFMLSVCAYWLCGIPLGLLLTKGLDFGVIGYWIGIAVGLGVAAVGYGIRLCIVMRRMRRQADGI